jgi:hypothetical protein
MWPERGPDLAYRDSPCQGGQAESMIGMGMGQHHQIQSIHAVLAEILHEDDRVRTAIDKREIPGPTRNQDGIALPHIQNNGPVLGQ